MGDGDGVVECVVIGVYDGDDAWTPGSLSKSLSTLVSAVLECSRTSISLHKQLYTLPSTVAHKYIREFVYIIIAGEVMSVDQLAVSKKMPVLTGAFLTIWSTCC